MCHKVHVYSVFLTICGVFCFVFESQAQKINPSQLEINAEDGNAYFGRLRILLPCDTIQLSNTKIEGDIFDSYYDGKSFLLITVDKYGTYVLNGGEKISGKWVHDLHQYYLNADDSGMCRTEILGVQIIDGVTILVQSKTRGSCYGRRKSKDYYFGKDGDEPGNPNGLTTYILRVCKDGTRIYPYMDRGEMRYNYDIDPNTSRPDK